MPKLYLYITVFLWGLLNGAWLCAAQKIDEVPLIQVGQPIELTLETNSTSWASQIDEALKDSFLLQAVTCESDVYMSQAEFCYLTDLREGMNIGANDIKKACGYLIKKNSFSKIIITIEPKEHGSSVHFNLIGFWTFKKLKIHGIVLGRDSFLQHYLMEAGDLFSMAKHRQSIDKILESFRSNGYYNATIDSSFDRNPRTKQVTVHITLHQGFRFYIDQVHLEIKKDPELMGVEDAQLQTDLYKLFFNRMYKSSYSKDFISQEIKSLKRYLEKKGFLDADISLQERTVPEERSVLLDFTISLHHKKEFVFMGNHFFSFEQLIDSLLMFGKSAWMLPISILCEELQQLYQKRGFWDVTVKAQEESDRYIFTLQEGVRARVKKVVLKYAHSFDNTMLIKQAFRNFVHAKHYDAELLAQSLDELKAWYAKEGFQDMKILKQEFLPLGKDKHMLVLTIEEGARYYITNVSIEPYPELTSQGPFAKICQGGSVPFDNAIIMEQRRWLLDHFFKQGYAHVEAKPELIRDTNNVSIAWKVTVSQHKLRFGKTIVMGETRFPFELIMRELQYKQGQVWDKDALKQTFSKLKGLEIFEDIHLLPAQGVGAEDEKPILLKVSEDDPYEIRLRAGLELQNLAEHYTLGGITYRLGGAFIAKSPCNIGDQFRFDADFARGHREVAAKYTLPWILNMPVKTMFMGYANAYDQPGFIGSPCNLYQLTQSGFLVGFSRKFGYVDAGFNFGFEWMKTKTPDRSMPMCALIESVARAINFNPRLLDQSVPFVQCEPTVLIDLLDSKLNPTKGAFTVLSLKGMFPLRNQAINSYFIKGLVEQSFFVPIRSFVAAFRVRFGHIFHRCFSAIMPSERFYLGGANSLRGYESDLAGPLGAFCDCDGKERFAPQGGKSMVNLNAELRFPIFKNIGGVIFQDLGALSGNTFADFNPCDILASTGFGLRFNTPIGPLRFDIGWKWGRHVRPDHNYAWYLTFGQAF